ncbi:unnamed protein product [Eruca vesicaria subsp. sativa]|uniref:Uncharacterized protein n=1 Tax=Eruca vesicaria subsp. sativa TaxID=29727 RepID=A0ABC8J3I8_ERUVS|nr:unnamed protein product [Eruca vesicaria subsp. sativa]
MKFEVGYMVSSGQPTKEYIDFAVKHVLFIQSLLGINVKVLFDWDPIRQVGPMTQLLDVVIIHAPKGKYVNPAPAQVVTLAALLLEAPLTAVDYPEMIPAV